MMAEAPEEIFIYVAKDTGRVNLLTNPEHFNLPHAIKYVPAVPQPLIKTQHFGSKELPLASVLFALAGQENNDGDEGNAMQAAGEFIKKQCTPVQGICGACGHSMKAAVYPVKCGGCGKMLTGDFEDYLNEKRKERKDA
jgi:hypothetical protein